MKKLAILALAAMSVFAIACDPDNDTQVSDETMVGEWTFSESHHSVVVDLKKDGTYTWVCVDFKHTGKWSVAGSEITFNASKFYMSGVAWAENGTVRISDGKWEETEAKNHLYSGTSGTATYTITPLVTGAAFWKLKTGNISDPIGDHQMLMYSGNLNVSIKSGEIDGTWSAKDENGESRLIVQGSNFTFYEYTKGSNGASATCVKTVGTWTYSKGYMNIAPTNQYYSYTRENTEYVYSNVNAETLEAETWTPVSYALDAYKVRVILNGNTLTGYFNPWEGNLITLIKQ